MFVYERAQGVVNLALRAPNFALRVARCAESGVYLGEPVALGPVGEGRVASSLWGRTVLRSDAVGQQRAISVADSAEDPRVAGLSAAVARLRAELAAHPAQLRDRRTAEDELDAIDVQLAEGASAPEGLRHSLLLIVAAVGSVSALAEALSGLRNAIELFGEPSDVRGSSSGTVRGPGRTGSLPRRTGRVDRCSP
jgi:hypothetical protein